MTNRWTLEDDERLWASRSKPTAALADEFDRSQGGIRSRLKHLQNPDHHAFQRLFGASVGLSNQLDNLWSRYDDAKLWKGKKRGGKSIAVLADEFGQSQDEIRSRLQNLRNLNHPAYQRLFGSSNPGEGIAGKLNYALGLSVSRFPNKVSHARQAIAKTRQNVHSIEPPPSYLRDVSKAMSTPIQWPPKSSYARGASMAMSTPIQWPPTFPNLHATDTRQNSAVPALNDSYSKGYSVASTKHNPSSSVTLNPEQKRVLELVLTGRNVFLTGAAGVGKSFLLRHIVDVLKSRCVSGGDSIAVTASTGIAASHISGTTLHSWAGIGIASGKDVWKLVQKVQKNQAAFRRWRTTQTLIIDEISMIDGVLFQALDELGKALRGVPGRPFGGLQLILSGDLYQLPPVSLRYAGFAFSSNAWKNGNIVVAELKTVIRQEGDLKFVRILRELREGKCSSSTENLLATCNVPKKKGLTDGIVPTKLYCTNKNVDTENKCHLDQLTGQMRSYLSEDRFKGYYSSQVQSNLRKMMDKKAPAVLCLKRGAQVMLLKNTPEWNLVNGSRGVVVDFDENNSDYPMVLFSNGATHTIEPFEVFQPGAGGAMTRKQLPIKLAWCLTVHKSQGMTLDRLEVQLEDAFDYGQVYVALSRVTSLAGLWIKGTSITQKMVKAHPDVIEFHRNHRHDN